MNIFDQEIKDGLQEQIKSSACIAYSSMAEPCTEVSKKEEIKDIKTTASYDDADLYYVQSILVSSSWNKNDDIFEKSEVWAAKNTPEDKPTNLEHDENLIIGHITSNWPISENGEVLEEGIDMNDLPEKYHILTGSVIYRGFSNPELKERAENLIAEIENGTKYVSMECFFKGFDYGVEDQTTGSYKVLARDENTAYLTKYLRAYGGVGEHENYKIGRVLRNITFSGKGFVDKPANEDSIIFNKNLIKSQENILEPEEKINDFNKTGVLTTQSSTQSESEINTMSLENDIADIKTKLEAKFSHEELQSANVELKTQLAQTEAGAKAELAAAVEAKETIIAELNTTISEKDSVIAQRDEEIVQKDEAIAAKEAELASKEEVIAKHVTDIEAANEVVAGYKAKEDEMMKKEKKAKRMASLVEAGLDNETVGSTADKFEHLSDESFEDMTALLAGMSKKEKKEEKKAEDDAEAGMPPALKEALEEKKKKEEKDKASEVIADAEILEEVEVEEEVNLGIGSEVESEEDSTRAALVDFVRSRLNTSTK